MTPVLHNCPALTYFFYLFINLIFVFISIFIFIWYALHTKTLPGSLNVAFIVSNYLVK